MNAPLEWLVYRHRAAMFISLCLLLCAGSGLRYLEFDEDIRKQFSESDRERQIYEHFSSNFGTDEALLIALAPRGGDIFTSRTITALAELTERAWHIPFCTRVESLVNYQRSEAIGDGLSIDGFLDPDSLSAETLAEKKTIALQDIAVVNRLLSPDGEVAAIILDLSLPQKGVQDARAAAVEFIDELREDIEANYPELQFYATGHALAHRAILDTVLSDQGVLLMMNVAIFALLGLLFRSLVAMVGVFAVTLCAIVAGLGVTGWMGLSLNSLSAFAINVITPITVAHCVHLLSSFFAAYDTSASKRDAIRYSLQHNIRPITIAALTTAVSFLSMNLADMPSYAEFGNIVALGVSFAYLFSLLLLPALLAALPVKPRRQARTRLLVILDAIASRVIAKRYAVLVGVAALALGLSSLALNNVSNERYISLVDPQHQWTQDNQFIDNHFGNMYTLRYEVRAAGPGGITEPTYLEHLSAFTDWLREYPNVTSVYSFSDIIRQFHQSTHDGDPQFYAIPADAALTAQYALLYQLSVPKGTNIDYLISHDESSTSLTVTFPNTDSRGVYRLRNDIRQWMTTHLPPSMWHEGTGKMFMLTHSATSALANSLRGALVAVCLITVMLMLSLKSVKMGLVSLVPNALPVTAGFGIWALLDGELGLTIFVVFGISIGIVVDDTVHFLKKYQDARQQRGLNPEQAIRFTFETVGPALCTTTLILAVGFGIMAFSIIPSNAAIGLLSAMIVAAALLLDFLLLPALLLCVEKTEAAEPERPDEQTTEDIDSRLFGLPAPSAVGDSS